MKVLVGSDKIPHRRLTVRVIWEPRDIWIGVFWNHTENRFWATPRLPSTARFLLVYVALIPCLPICFAWRQAADGALRPYHGKGFMR